jgi:uncharacterized damage-inducible protein DinB
MADSYRRLDIAAQWGRLNDTILALVDVIPEDKLDWSPRDDLWNFQGILAHVATTRHSWLETAVGDGETTPDVFGSIKSKEGVKEQLRVSWARVERFLSDQAKLDKLYEGERRGKPYSYSGHWIAFHLLEHDIHHRADIFHYLGLLEIEHPEVETP